MTFGFIYCFLWYLLIGGISVNRMAANSNTNKLLDLNSGLFKTLGYMLLWPYVLYLGVRSWWGVTFKPKSPFTERERQLLLKAVKHCTKQTIEYKSFGVWGSPSQNEELIKEMVVLKAKIEKHL